MTTTDVIGYVKINGIRFPVFLNGTTDGATQTEIKFVDDGGATRSIGEGFEGGVLEEIALQASDGSILSTVSLFDQNAGIVGDWVGNERTARDMVWNLRVENLQMPISRGMVLKVATAD